MTDHPYKMLPNKAFWSREIAAPARGEVDPVGVFDLRIDRQHRVATGGSCFAQHIARHLRVSGFHHFVAEPGHPLLPEPVREKNNYGLFSCRYGNIYTARQLWQLFQRAYGQFEPEEGAWLGADDVVIDPFRPGAQPGGFVCPTEMRLDRAQHLSAVRRMFEELDVFVFTLGLTECWRSRSDGAVFPLCPGVKAGTFDPKQHEFYNQTVDEVVDDLAYFRKALERVNAAAQIVLTVSPVPLAATAEPGAHVLSATTYSKSVLRVAAEKLRRKYRNVHYFPSYEIIAGSFNRGAYYASDLRNVLEEGVDHVMRMFMKHATGLEADRSAPPPSEEANKKDYLSLAQQIVNVECDEAALDLRFQ